MSTRTALGFLVAPTAIPIGLFLTDWIHDDGLTNQLGELLFGLIVWYLYPLFFALIFALPLYLLLNRFDLVRWWSSLGAGLLIGVLGAMSMDGQTPDFYTKIMLLSGVSGLVFYYIAKHRTRRPSSSQ